MSTRRTVSLGVIEFHSPWFNPGLMERFYAVTKDLRDSGRGARDTTIAECAGNESDDEECKCPTKHGFISYFDIDTTVSL